MPAASPIQAEIIIGWPSTAGSIPFGWQRVAALDGRYVRGAAALADGGTLGGSTTHTHTSPSHTPTQAAHTHSVYTLGSDADSTAKIINGTSTFLPDPLHGHSAVNATSQTGTNQGVAITVNANTSNDLAYTSVIWVKSLGTALVFPAGCVAFFESDSIPANWARFANDTYLRGANTGADGGATGGSNTHTHTSPAHTHIQNSHNHGNTTSGAALSDAPVRRNNTTGTVIATLLHTHTVQIGVTIPTNQPVTTTINAANHEPPYKKLNTIKASTDDASANIVALWTGTVAALTGQWARVTSMDGFFHKSANVNGESGVATGGATQHNHTASDCQPVQDAHTHSVIDFGTSNSGGNSGAGVQSNPTTHKHTTWTADATVATNNAATVTINQCNAGDAYPPFFTALFVRFDPTFVPTPTVKLGGYTSYDINRFDIGSPEDNILPENAKKIAQGDLRFVPGRT